MAKYDVLIIGAGPAGLTAAIYLARNNMDVAFIESYAPGGKIIEQSKIENYPGFDNITGPSLATHFYNQATRNGASLIFGKAIKIISNGDFDKTVIMESGEEYHAKAIIIATGMKNRIPSDIVNIEKFNHRGVSYCVLCDGVIFKNQPCAIIGGGNSAFEESISLASLASEVHIFVRDGIIAEKRLVDDVKKHSKIIVHENSQVLELIGQDELEAIKVNINGEVSEMKIKGLFPYIGQLPATDFLDKEILNERKFIEVDHNMETKIKNIFAAGDVVAKDVRQITTATSDGTIAAKTINSRIVK
ncbi:thioredoxin reductase [Metamycoplasma arthritidis]|uniref:Thioredoxin reductase n=1 Tax=Metamycoplasma arthritidis (strain 158L3-1) TaxID=243272 RepID=B3PMS7_META1|nr:FAD-dependent oxidoreductase [Metamycoplasma arthritidis]ACF07329.1 thioredoxin reductase [Metamycoplasma arthritidis 158L3-1]VEU78852.1 thioredoxin reductase [Metamycoplasma arthritidis]